MDAKGFVHKKQDVLPQQQQQQRPRFKRKPPTMVKFEL